ncbi:hypothetical protein TNCV_2930761 [Trichonephila clavipes]|nr:hypothetical protein TNCV_2930761 [Trichonephila clavipes]
MHLNEWYTVYQELRVQRSASTKAFLEDEMRNHVSVHGMESADWEMFVGRCISPAQDDLRMANGPRASLPYNNLNGDTPVVVFGTSRAPPGEGRSTTDPNTREALDWPRGHILEVLPSSDGLVRVVDVKTSTGILKPAITKIVPTYSS